MAATELVLALLALADPDHIAPSSAPDTPLLRKQALNKHLRYTDHLLPPAASDQPSRTVRSWKMADFAYKKDPCPFPTRARGLFTEELDSPERQWRIIARGYDKFFNVDEVPWTQPAALLKLTAAPYELTHKANGCIILIAALSPSTVLVTSKHSLGANRGATSTGEVSGEVEDKEEMVSSKGKGVEKQQDGETLLSHAEMGEAWLMKHLERSGKKVEDLAKVLWESNLTAVAELCDDSFEEHVLPYPSHLTGLHLHGLNHNTAILSTLPSTEVQRFAREWGLIETPFKLFESLEELGAYVSEVEAAGGVLVAGEGEAAGKIIPVEGFVVRAVKAPLDPSSSTSLDPPPSSKEHEPFFWKIKFDQPYLLFREWREITRKLLLSTVPPPAAGPAATPLVPLPPAKMNLAKIKSPLSRLYIHWVTEQITLHPEKFARWGQGRDIIKVREEFLAWKESAEGSAMNQEFVMLVDEARPSEGPWERTLLVPVGIPGAGKTSLGIALNHLFGFGHTQSDDIVFKKTGKYFIENVKKLLVTHPVVFADKNNHQKTLRSDLLKLASSSPLPTRTIAFHWSTPSLPKDSLHAICSHRIVTRGQNHQNLRQGSEDLVLRLFFGQQEAFDEVLLGGVDAGFEEVWTVDFRWTREEVLEECCKFLFNKGIIEQLPSEEKRTQALEVVDRYRTAEIIKGAPDSKKAPTVAIVHPPRYYGISVKVDLKDVLGSYFAEEGAPGRDIWETLGTVSKLTGVSRIEREPHITLVHEKEVELEGKNSTGPVDAGGEDKKDTATTLWALYKTLSLATPSPAPPFPADFTPIEQLSSIDPTLVQLTLGPLLAFNDRVMSVQVSAIDSPSVPVHLVDNRPAHITIGTLDSLIRPIEGKMLMEKALQGEALVAGGTVLIQEIRCWGRIAGLR